LAVIKLPCLTGCTANGPDSCGSCGSNAVAAKWMVAQIAQYSSASLIGCRCGSEGTDLPATERRSVECRSPPRWTWPKDRTICSVNANSPSRAPIFKFALNHCITGQLIAMRLGPLVGYATIAQVRSGISNRRGFVSQSVISCIAARSWPCGPAGGAILAHTLFGAKPTKTDTLPTITRGCRAVLRVNSPIDLSDAASGQFVIRRQLPVKIE
jgi:hypothetical protein